MEQSQCFQDDILLSYDDYSTVVGYILTALGIFGSIMIILTKNRYFSKGSEFGYLVLSIGILDLLTSLAQLSGSLTSAVLQYDHCVGNTTSSMTENYYISQVYRLSDVFLFASGNLGVAVSFIAYSIACRNGINHILNWKKLLMVCIVLSLIVYLGFAIYYDRMYGTDTGADWTIYYYMYDVYASILVLLFLFFYLSTHLNLYSKKSSNSPKLLMLTMIQAVTISNLVCWLPMILSYTFTILLSQSSIVYNQKFSSTVAYIASATIYAKGFYHICALYFAELFWKQKPVDKQEDTIKWDFTLSKAERISELEETL
ncbi:hypothetical protein HDV01_001700 [Terramyces sp. JEL0728]|nr:hypothetical protein HDV01_001700 [Terramyces sp. JEL0728]